MERAGVQVETGKSQASRSSSSGLLQRQCACGTHTMGGGLCAECQKKQMGVDGKLLQTKLAISEPGDEYEQEADRVAEQVMRMSAGDVSKRRAGNRTRPLVQRRATSSATGLADAPATVHDVLGSPGRPLEPVLLQEMEQRFGQDFSRVRVHTDSAAEQSARDVNAHAYTVGRDIVFGEGRFARGTPDGQRLLAHELVHVLQQVSLGGASVVQRKKGAPQTPPETAFVTIPFAVKVDRAMTSDELLVEIVRQYRKFLSKEEAAKEVKRGEWQWTKSPVGVTEADVKKRYVLIDVTDRSLRPQDTREKQENRDLFKQLSAGEQSEINTEADRQFWKKTQYKSGVKLGQSADDRRMAEAWRVVRDELLRQRKEIESLPPNLKNFLFNEGAENRVRPEDYTTVLRIAQKLGDLNDAELEDYKNKVTAKTQSWAVFEDSIDGYLQARTERRQAAETRESIKKDLFGLEGAYKLYKDWKTLKSISRMIPRRDEFGVVDPNKALIEAEVRSTKSQLISLLAQHRFASIGAFEEAIASYEQAFRKETLLIAEDVLQRYEHVLYVEEQKYRVIANALALHRAVAGSQAEASYEQAKEEQSIANTITPDPELHRFLPGEWEMKKKHQEAARTARAHGAAEVVQFAGAHPLIKNRDFDKEALARAADESAVQRLMLDYIHARREDIGKTRSVLAKDEEQIYKSDDLLRASFQQQGIEPGKIEDLIIQDKIRQVHADEAFLKIGLAILTVAVSLLTFGTGTVAMLAAIATFGLGAYQAVEEFHEFEKQQALYGAGMSSRDPSPAWVVLAVLGAGLDFAGAVAAIGAMQVPIKTFETTNDVARLEKELAKLSGINAALRRNVVKAAEAEAGLRSAAKSFLSTTSRLNIVILAPEGFVDVVRMLYYLAKRGVIGFDTWIKELRAQKILSETAEIAAEDLTKLKALFTDAKSAADDLLSHGKSLGMKEHEVDDFINLWGQAKTAKREQIKEQMSIWAAQGNRRSASRKAIIASSETTEAGGKIVIKSEGRIGEPPMKRPGLEKKYPFGKDVGLPGHVRFHVEGIKAVGDELNVVYAPSRFNISETALIENQIRVWHAEVKATGGELYFEITAKCHLHMEFEGAQIKLLDEITWKLERRVPGSDNFETLFEHTGIP
jgi:hypothetical protein